MLTSKPSEALGASKEIPILSMIGSKLISFETFFLIKSKLFYYCHELDKRYYEKCERQAQEFRGHFSVNVFDVMWNESGQNSKSFDMRYNLIFRYGDSEQERHKMGFLYENSTSYKSLMKISLLSDGHVMVLDWGEFHYHTNVDQYLELLREYILISKMSGRPLMIIVNVDTYYEQKSLDKLMRSIENILSKFGMEKVKIIGVNLKTSENFKNEFKFEKKPHPLFSDLSAYDAIIQFRKETVLVETQNINVDSQPVFAIMGKEKIGGVGSTMIGRVLSGSISVDQELVITDTILSTAKSLEQFHEPLSVANRGQFCGIALRNILVNDIPRGSVIGLPSVNTFEALVVITYSPKKGWKVGVTPTVFSLCERAPCRVVSIVERLSKKTKKIITKDPTTCNENELVRLRFTCTKGMHLTTDERWRRIILVHNNKIMGGGLVVSLQ